jgi:mannosyl-oligosaccharide alpha-1,2-mannosidase
MRATLSLSLVALGLVGSTTAYPQPYQDTETVLSASSASTNQQKADAVKEAFQHAWNGYMKYAFPHDELHPVSNGYGDSR